MHALVLLDNIGIVSSYLPDSWKSLDLFIEAVEALKVACDMLRERGAQAFVIGGDMQIELQPDILECTGPRAMGRATARDYWDRHQILVGFLQKYRCCAANTWAPAGNLAQTRIPFGKAQADGSQLDYLFASRSLTGTAAVHPSRIFRSDHLCVAGAFSYHSTKDFRQPRKSLKGWRPVNGNEENKFKTYVVEDLLGNVPAAQDSLDPPYPCHDRSKGQDHLLRHAPLDQILDTITQRAMDVQYHSTSSVKKKLSERPEDLKHAEKQLRDARNKDDKKRWRGLAQRLRRRWKARRMLGQFTSNPRSSMTVRTLACDGHPTVDRAAWAKALQNHCRLKYTDQAVNPARVRSWRSRLKEYGKSTPLGVSQASKWDIHITMDARTRFSKGKAAGGEDVLVPEMILALPWTIVYIIHCEFFDVFAVPSLGSHLVGGSLS
jgi:hypothetical protein